MTTLVVKDRVTGHNPAAVLYGQNFYYKRLQKQPRITSYNVCYTKLLRGQEVALYFAAARGERQPHSALFSRSAEGANVLGHPGIHGDLVV